VAPRYVLSNPAALRFACGCPRITQAHHTAGETTSSTWTPAPAALKTEDDSRQAPSATRVDRYQVAEGVGDVSKTLASFGVLPSACAKVHGYARLVPNRPGVVARLRKQDIPRTDFALSVVIHTDAHAPG
jgi:hypothetical protein